MLCRGFPSSWRNKNRLEESKHLCLLCAGRTTRCSLEPQQRQLKEVTALIIILCPTTGEDRYFHEFCKTETRFCSLLFCSNNCFQNHSISATFVIWSPCYIYHKCSSNSALVKGIIHCWNVTHLLLIPFSFRALVTVYNPHNHSGVTGGK